MAKTEMMGFEKDKRIRREFNNVRVRDFGYNFRSKFEHRWAQYLNLLQEQGHIRDWFYESIKFYFPGETTAPIQYTPDFEIHEQPDGLVVFQECKGYHDGQTNTKLRRMAKHHPDIVMELVLMRIPKRSGKGANRRRVAAKYTRRVIDGGKILRQCGL